MPMIIPLGFAQVTHVFIGGQVPQGAVTTYGVEAGWLNAQAATGDIHASFGAEIMPFLCNSVTLERTIVKLGPTSSGAVYEFVQAIEGDDGGEPEPPQVAYLLRKRTASGGRRNRGRMYLPGPTTASVDVDGTVTTTKQVNLTTGAEAHRAFLAANDSPMVVLHDGPQVPTVVTALLCDARVATQRRRLR